MSEELDSQLAVIQSGQWQEAVFTTYALSLTFFESCLLPALRHSQCEKVTIFADVDGYRSSLMERRAASAGREYAVVPVQVGSGIFHPKCTYLFGERHDALLVGSGNLTFGGHGKNVEVLEVLLSDVHPRCFLDFANFVDALLVRTDVHFADRTAMERMGHRARQLGRPAADTPVGTIELLHSTGQAILPQLQARLPARGRVKEVLVLSPYHHSTGQPVRDLLAGTGAKKLLIGVPSDGSATSFPLAAVAEWGVEVQCVRPHVASRKRGLHAKWWELRSANETLTLTGSVNATHESFATTNNIEIGVLRRLKKPVADAWDEVEPPRYEKDDFYRADGASLGVVYATVNGEGRVKGRILGIAEPQGVWGCRIDAASDAEREVKVDADGSFNWRDSRLLTATRTLQLDMQRETDIARGWLGNDAVLRMPSRSRTVAQAVVRMLLREETADDVEAMFDYIATETAAALTEAPTARSTTGAGTPNAAPADDETISTRELEDAGGSADARLLRDLSIGQPSAAQRLSILDSVAAVLLGSSSRSGSARTSNAEIVRHARGGSSEDEDEVAEQVARQDALDRFNSAMESHLEHAEVNGRLLGIALRVWLNVNLDMQLRRLGSTEDAWLFCRRWIGYVLRSSQDPESRAILAECFSGLVGGLLARSLEVRTAETAVSEVALTPRIVHEWLDQFFGNMAAPEEILAAVAQWLEHDLARSMFQDEGRSAITAIETALATPTAGRILAELVAAHAAGKRVEIPSGLFSAELMKQLERLQRAPRERPIHKVVTGTLPGGCPKCYVKLIGDIRSRLRANRVAECMNCHAVIVWLGSDDEAR